MDVKAIRGSCYRCVFTPTEPGFYRINVSSEGKPLSNSPASLQVTIPPKIHCSAVTHILCPLSDVTTQHCDNTNVGKYNVGWSACPEGHRPAV